jgi:hypothetical protein
VLITTKIVSSNPVHGEVYSIQHYVIKFVSDLWQVSGFLQVTYDVMYIFKLQVLLMSLCNKTITILSGLILANKNIFCLQGYM